MSEYITIQLDLEELIHLIELIEDETKNATRFAEDEDGGWIPEENIEKLRGFIFKHKALLKRLKALKSNL